jgi:hypothetical protein
MILNYMIQQTGFFRPYRVGMLWRDSNENRESIDERYRLFRHHAQMTTNDSLWIKTTMPFQRNPSGDRATNIHTARHRQQHTGDSNAAIAQGRRT